MLEFLQEIDEKILFAVNAWNSDFFDGIMWWVSGKITWWPFYLVLLAYLFYKKPPLKALIILGITILLISLSDQSSVHLFKNVFLRLRPSRNPDLEGMLHFVNDYRGGKYGFISSHAANSFALATFFFLCFGKNWTGFVLFFWAALVSYSRMYLGVHYFFDVLAGAVWGALLASGVFLLFSKYILKKPLDA